MSPRPTRLSIRILCFLCILYIYYHKALSDSHHNFHQLLLTQLTQFVVTTARMVNSFWLTQKCLSCRQRSREERPQIWKLVYLNSCSLTRSALRIQLTVMTTARWCCVSTFVLQTMSCQQTYSSVKCLQRVSAVVYLYGVDKRVVVCSSNSDLICYVWTESHATLTDLPWRIRCAPYWFLNSKDMK